MLGYRVISPLVTASQRLATNDVAALFSGDNHLSSPVTRRRAAFVCGPADTGDQLMFDAPALCEETLLDVSNLYSSFSAS